MNHDQVRNELLERRAQREARKRDVERAAGWMFDELSAAWRSAHAEATQAYELWSELPGRDGYAVYRAAQDRADEAQDALWQRYLLDDTARTLEVGHA
jgi:hypothetical protein